MAELVLEGHEPREPIPDGEILAAEVTFADESTKTYDPAEGPKEIIKFKFRVTEEGEFKGRVLTADLSKWFSTNPQCRLRAWVLELLNEDELPEGFKLDTSYLVGSACRIVVGARPYRAKDGSPQVWNSVTDVIRASGVASASAADIF